MNPIFEFFNLTFKELKLSARWVAIILFVFLTFVMLLSYENLTGHFYLAQIEKKITLLKELQSIANAGVENNPELKPIYESTANELSSYKVRSIISFIPSIKLGNTEALGKAISGSLLWIVVGIFMFITEIQKNGKLTGTIIGSLVLIIIIGAIFAWIGTLIPTLYNPWVNYIAFPLSQIILIAFLISRTKT